MTAGILILTVNARAQTCSGSLGDPVILQTFGAGPNPGPALPSSVTTFRYTTNSCAEDGFYTILNSTSGCHSDWHNVPHDHTGDPNGYMMLVNASYQPIVFFTQTANGLCPNTTYEFSAYIMNLGTLASAGSNYSHPDITFTVKKNDGTVLATYNTGTIMPTADAEWTKYGTYFVTPAGVTDVIVTMTNNAPGGNGNDLLLDDIAFRACGPIIQTGFGNLSLTDNQTQCRGTNATYTLTANVGAGYVNPFLQWQVNYNNTGWTNLPGLTNSTVSVTLNNPQPGTYQYRLSAGEGQNESSSTCNTSSEPLSIIVYDEPPVTAVVSNNVTICAGSSTTLSASGGLYYQWTPSTGLDHADVANPVASPTQTTTYSVKVSNDGCSDDTKSVTVTVNKPPGADAGKQLYVLKGQSVRLNGVATGDNITSVYWTPPDGLDKPTSLTPLASPQENTTYTLHVVSQNCGEATSNVQVKVFTQIKIPNTFSPNGDGVNDYWDIDGLIAFPQCLATIYSRDGQQIYKSIGYVKPWDGTYKGTALPVGTYYYIIDLKDGQPPLSGWVAIVR
ncbi:MAG: gliding motility-associated C-terminal domain-containing protein [Bacteroidetes bacterium]|nr:gliding motility-associated C-terminal domain-containing protein [Bacteroidota bacterium]